MPVDGDTAKRIARLRVLFLDFDGVFTDNTVYVNERGEETVRCWRGDGLGLSRLKQSGVQPVIVSTESNAVVPFRAAKMKIVCHHGIEDKLAAIAGISRELGAVLDECGFVGNDINDLTALRAVGFAAIVGDAHPSVAAAAHYRTVAAGGQGAVREICDLIVDARDSARA